MKRDIIELALRDLKDEFSKKINENTISRKEEELINLESSLAQVVIGVRRSGKSTLSLNVIKKSDYKFAYVNFDDERLLGLQTDDLNIVLELLYKIYGDFTHLFLDEVQNIDGWYVFINRLLRSGIKIIVTGSNAKLLGGELATHLTGRYIQTELFPFSFAEYCSYNSVQTKIETTKDMGLLLKSFDDYLKTGGFPELFKEKRKQVYVNTLVKNIFINDIERRYSVYYKIAFEQMAEHIIN
ncbi:MAG: AAA family ATPase, partial [Sphaerochaetaceae bacterium]|nr:AAA family ATPase [Sphaerochaetaceae bacterium]